MVFILLGGCAGKGRTVETLQAEDGVESGIRTESVKEHADGGESGIRTESAKELADDGKSDDGSEAAGSGRLTDTSGQIKDESIAFRDPAGDKTPLIYVDVCGAVKAPGVVTVPEGSRVFEAIAKAGGLREDADARYINQARLLSDGEQVYVPTTQETAAKEDGFSEAGLSRGANAAGPDGSRISDAFAGTGGDPGMENAGSNADGKVNINTADSAALQTLNGIGEARAEAIILYRETNGAFETIEDIMKVSGIKNALFNKIKDDITVG